MYLLRSTGRWKSGQSERFTLKAPGKNERFFRNCNRQIVWGIRVSLMMSRYTKSCAGALLEKQKEVCVMVSLTWFDFEIQIDSRFALKHRSFFISAFNIISRRLHGKICCQILRNCYQSAVNGAELRMFLSGNFGLAEKPKHTRKQVWRAKRSLRQIYALNSIRTYTLNNEDGFNNNESNKWTIELLLQPCLLAFSTKPILQNHLVSS